MKTFDQFLGDKSYEALLQETAEIMIQLVEAGIDPEELLEESKEMLLEGGWSDSFNTGANISKGIGSGLMGALGGTAGVAAHGIGSGLSGLWGGVKQGFKQFGRHWNHGSNAHNASFQVQDALGFLNKAVAKLQSMGQTGQKIGQRVQYYSNSLNKLLQNIVAYEKNPNLRVVNKAKPQPAAPTPQPAGNPYSNQATAAAAQPAGNPYSNQAIAGMGF